MHASINPELRDKVERLSNLPTLPQVASRLLSVIADPDASAADVGNIVGQDISLSAKILRLANSAYYGTPRAISTIQAAVVRLGFKLINTIALSLTVFDMFPADKRTAHFDRAAFWRHCIRSAVLAKIIARISKRTDIDPEEAFCAGLLHDIGKIVMEQYLHKDFSSALEHARANGMSFYHAEINSLGYSHADVAHWLISRWELPDQLFYPIICHHSPASAEACGQTAYACHVADYLCYSPDMAPADNGSAPPLADNSIEFLKLDASALATAQSLFAEEFGKAGLLLELLK